MTEKTGRITLSESLMALGVVLIVFGLSVDSLLDWRGSSNEDSCMASLGSLVAANEQYRTRFRSYAASLRDLQSAALVDSVLGSGTKSGYDFSYTAGAEHWRCQGNPNIPGTTGDRHFFADQTGVIRFSGIGPANATHPTAQWPRRSPPGWISPTLTILGVLALVTATGVGVLRHRRGNA